MTLTHFTRKRRVNLQMPVTLAGTTVQPEPSIKVLGVLLDTQLKWGAQEQAVWKKMGNQMLALQRTTTSTWGATMPKARQVYQAVVHPAIAHGAPAWHQPTKPKDKKRGLARKLQDVQEQGLQTVLGAFKATPLRRLEMEAYVPPLDLWLNGRLAKYQARLESTGIGAIIQAACSMVRNRLRNHLGICRTMRGATPGQKRKVWTAKWIGKPVEQWDWREKPLVEWDWTERWWAAGDLQENRLLRPGTDPGGHNLVWDNTAPTKKVLQLHSGLQKAESALLVQARTGKIGLGKFLHDCRVPGFETGQCWCGPAFETPRHMVMYCKEEADRGLLTGPTGTKWSYPQLIGHSRAVKGFVRWMMYSGRLSQFELAKCLLYDSK